MQTLDSSVSTCAMVKSRYIGDGHPTFNRNPYELGIYKPLRTWVDKFIPYYMEIMGEFRPYIKIALKKKPPGSAMQ